jgi:hypothetical protein
MPEFFVMTVRKHDAPSADDAEKQTREIESRYEGDTLVVAADSLDNLPHPMSCKESTQFGWTD